MANLGQELQKFKTSVMGEEIRDALFNSVTLMNNEIGELASVPEIYESATIPSGAKAGDWWVKLL